MCEKRKIIGWLRDNNRTEDESEREQLMKKLTLIADVLLISLSAGLFLPNSTINMAKYQSDNNKSLITEKDNITPEEVMDNQIPDELYDVGNEDQWYISQAVRRAVDKEEADNNAEIFRKDDTSIVNCREIKDKEDNILRYIYKYSDGGYCISGSDIGYRSASYTQLKYEYYIPTQYGIKMSDESWYQLDELDDLSKEDCLADVSNILAELEIEVCDEPDIYVIDVDSQKKVKAKLQLTSELDDWTKDDECYCMIFKRKLDNQTMSDVAFDNILKSGVPTQVKVIYGKQGLIYLDTSYQYDFITKEDVKDKVISYDTAVNIAMTKYDYVSEQNIIRAELQYIPQVTGGDGIDYNTRYEIAPYWVIVIEIPSVIGENASKNEIIFVNAIDKTVYKDTFSNVIR